IMGMTAKNEQDLLLLHGNAGGSRARLDAVVGGSSRFADRRTGAPGCGDVYYRIPQSLDPTPAATRTGDPNRQSG
ncbi:MAG: hypothetical protein ACREO7_03035, partial [Pseudoxanthomonas sp.]